MRFHDLRASHGDAVFDRRVGVHMVAERPSHDPALQRVYAEPTKKSDAAEADIIGTMTVGVRAWSLQKMIDKLGLIGFLLLIGSKLSN